ncbi:multi-sensor signal transduction multi-kinase [Richelia sinica FACHB-800]|uniref:Multi-sensor signal transduction multi-kinase n=1 Tax=Richelia sinica FACHB-800 TaxID=1357546 RepID=A0A975Y548_9NOST|nr:histidine kinase dimerization/phosphoacceptor domain -containing protein [Richelia sinica]QXE23849.1 multi-sensor signal transduction multi-kinase [Richelia sinica FACHB-800]
MEWLDLQQKHINHQQKMDINLLFYKHPNPMWIYDCDNLKFLDINENALIKYGYSREEFLQMRITQIHSPEDVPMLLAFLAQNNNQLQKLGKWRHTRKDGQYIFVEIIAQVIDYQGKNACLVDIQDITEHKRVEVTLQDSEARFRAISQAIPIPLVIARLDDGMILYANPEFIQTFKFVAEDLLNLSIAELYTNNYEWQKLLTEFKQNGYLSTREIQFKKLDGTCFWMLSSLRYLKFNDQPSLLQILDDITERKNNELRLKAQAEREKLMRTVAQRIRQSLNLQDILNATVQEVRFLLEVDRVVVYQFASDMSGKIMAESVAPGWTVSLGVEVEDTCFQHGAGAGYYAGRKRAIPNIYKAGLSDCHVKLLERFEVKANLVVPILLDMNGENADFYLWGLLVAHQCSQPREWEESQLDLLDQLTVQLAIAIKQSNILQQAQIEITQRQKAETELRSALAEKEVLLKEIHHRVKNNLQIVSSLLQLQSDTFQDPEVIKALRESQNRIESISLIHKNLYTSPNIGQLNIAEYINTLAANLLISYQVVPGRINLETDIDAVNLNIDQAIPCGLVINELISNALKRKDSGLNVRN